MHTIKDVAAALGFGANTFYSLYVHTGIVKETGWFGNSRYWDDAGIVQAAVAINEHQKVREGRREAKRKARIEAAQVLAEKYKSGMMLEEIGAAEGMTRERVRQLLKEIGINKEHGGKHVRAISMSAKNSAARIAVRESHCMKSYGCTFAEFCAVTGSNRLGRHKNNRLLSLWWSNKTNAQRSSIPWLFTLPQYAALLDGRESAIGLARDSLVLGRKDKSGPFSHENCEFVTLAANSTATGGLNIARAKRAELARQIKAIADSGITLPVICKQFGRSKASVSILIAYAKRLESEERNGA